MKSISLTLPLDAFFLKINFWQTRSMLLGEFGVLETDSLVDGSTETQEKLPKNLVSDASPQEKLQSWTHFALDVPPNVPVVIKSAENVNETVIDAKGDLYKVESFDDSRELISKTNTNSYSKDTHQNAFSKPSTDDSKKTSVITPPNSKIWQVGEVWSGVDLADSKNIQHISKPETLIVPKSVVGTQKIDASTREKLDFKTPTWFQELMKGFYWTVAILAISIGLALITPDLYYLAFPADVVPVEAYDSGTALGGDFQSGTEARQAVLPPVDETLPEGSWLIIDKIGVRTQMNRTEDVDQALRQGVWWVPEFGDAGDITKPMILAAHRYGFKIWWESDYWKYNSFYYLPELEPGDFIEVIHDQRKWTYEIYAGEEGEEISDYDADLILYTCKHLKSPVRHFRYARLVDWEVDSQS